MAEIESLAGKWRGLECIQLKMNLARKPAISKVIQRGSKALLLTAVFLVFAAVMPPAEAQVSIGIGIGGPPPPPPPVCPYGYYNYYPYACAPVGYYGPGYFYNGIFLGVGPWAYWGYSHGWGHHRFNGSRGGRYYPGNRYVYGHRRYGGPANAHNNPGHGYHGRPAAAPRGRVAPHPQGRGAAPRGAAAHGGRGGGHGHGHR